MAMKKYNLDEVLPEEQIEEYIALKIKKAQKIDWNRILRVQRLSENFLEKYSKHEGFNWNQVSKYQRIAEDFIERHIDELDCDVIRNRMKLSAEIIDKYPQKLDQKIIMKALLERGWTKAIVKKFYPNHEEHWYKSDKVCYLYCLSIVKRIEDSEEFKKAIEKSVVRRNAAQKAKETRNNKSVELIEQMEIFVPTVPLDKLKRDAIEAWENWNKWKEMEGRRVEGTKWTFGLNTEDTKRITCNYIRHELTDYDESLAELLNNFNKNEIYYPLHEKYLEAIYQKYPKLKPKDEC